MSWLGAPVGSGGGDASTHVWNDDDFGGVCGAGWFVQDPRAGKVEGSDDDIRGAAQWRGGADRDGAGSLPFSARSLFDTERPERMELVLSGGSLRDVHTMRVPARLVASLWKVDDRATAESMKEFYAGFLRDGRRKSDGSIRTIGRGLYCRGSGDI